MLSADSPVPGTFCNPVIPGFHPDPTICRVGRDYWLATSSFEYFPGLPLFHSQDLVNWRPIGHALDRPSQISLAGCSNSEGIFAPTLRYHEGLFYLIATAVGGGGNFVLTATDPAGDWSDPNWLDEGGVEPWFDPSLFFDDDGKVYYTRRHGMEIWQATLDIATGKLLSPLVPVAQPMDSDDIEGPHLYRVGDYYYLLAAEGGTGWGHAITIGRSRHPNGPFTPCPHNPILTHRHLPNHAVRSTGHGDLVEAHDGTWWIVFLGTRHGHFGGSPFHHLGRETFLAPVDWIDGWPVINGGRPIVTRTRAPSFYRGSQSQAAEIRDDFEDPTLNSQWCLRRAPHPAAFSLTERFGWLRLWGQPGTLDDRAPEAFVGRRLDCPTFTVSVTLDYPAISDCAAAGLVLVLSDECHVELLATCQGGERHLLLKQRALSLRTVLWSEAIANGPWTLRLDGNWAEFRFSLTEHGGRTLRGPWIDRRLLCTELATGWTGLFVGLYATDSVSPQGGPADFTAFRYIRHAAPLVTPTVVSESREKPVSIHTG